MKVRQRIPGFIDATAQEAEFSTTDELLRIPWVAQWRDGFAGYVYCASQDMLMIDGTTKDGRRAWYVIGFVDGMVDLPEWEPPQPPAPDS